MGHIWHITVSLAECFIPDVAASQLSMILLMNLVFFWKPSHSWIAHHTTPYDVFRAISEGAECIAVSHFELDSLGRDAFLYCVLHLSVRKSSNCQPGSEHRGAFNAKVTDVLMFMRHRSQKRMKSLVLAICWASRVKIWLWPSRDGKFWTYDARNDTVIIVLHGMCNSFLMNNTSAYLEYTKNLRRPRNELVTALWKTYDGSS